MSTQLYADLEHVEARLQQSMRDIDGPLGELVRPQLRQTQPYVRAAAVLTAAYCARLAAPAHTPANRDLHVLEERTIALAAAVEMLHIALSLHTRLVLSAGRPPQADQAPADRADTAERTFFGSTILAGDYCFSRASQLAAETEHPRVVAHFAQTLQTLSEGLLRRELHGPDTGSAPDFDAGRTLLLAGVEGALLLHNHMPQTHATPGQAETDDPILAHAHRFAHALPSQQTEPVPASDPPPNGNHASPPDSEACRSQWQALYTWLQQI